MKKKVTVRYSEAFKIHVIRSLEEGRHGTVSEASRVYGVRGSTTVAGWIRKHGKNHLLGKVVHVMKAEERTEVERLRKRVRDLETALADAHVDLSLERAYVTLACEEAGIEDVPEFKKKHATGR